MSRVFFVIVPMVDLIERNSSKSTNNSIRMAKLTISASTFRLVRGDRNRLNGGDLFSLDWLLIHSIAIMMAPLISMNFS